jgi:hypothetical protein
MPPEYFEVDSNGKCAVKRGLRVAVDGTGHKNPRSLARSWAVCLTTRMLSMFPDDNEFNIKITKQKNKQVHFNVEVTRVA